MGLYAILCPMLLRRGSTASGGVAMGPRAPREGHNVTQHRCVALFAHTAMPCSRPEHLPVADWDRLWRWSFTVLKHCARLAPSCRVPCKARGLAYSTNVTGPGRVVSDFGTSDRACAFVSLCPQ